MDSSSCESRKCHGGLIQLENVPPIADNRRMPRYIFVTGGVVSSLGKGIATASIGLLLKRRGLRVSLLKFDPYLNVDPGTMNPYQHGEVFVTEDGAETDLDLGHYERFLDENMTRLNNVTAGQVYFSLIQKEREGRFLGKTVQVVPHLTEEIKSRIRLLAKPDVDVVISEIGGTVGDIESLPFLEAIRQMRLEEGPQKTFFIHITLVPFIPSAGEVKTKPTQHSVMKLREIGIQPDLLLCRVESELPREAQDKIALFANLPRGHVIEEPDVANIYKVPLILKDRRVDQIIVESLGWDLPEPSLEDWIEWVERCRSPKHTVTIALAGKYVHLKDAYKSVFEALDHAACALQADLQVRLVNTEWVEKEGPEPYFADVDGILIPGGFGHRGVEGKIQTVRYAREQKVPYLGLCLGMQVACIEFARHVIGWPQANSKEFDPDTPYPVITLLPGQGEDTPYGGTLRLGGYPAILARPSRAYEVYGQEQIVERHRHRYEFNPKYRALFEQHGMRLSGISPDGTLVEIVEIPDHPFFIAVQFHPEFKSRPLRPHPLFYHFLKAALAYRKARLSSHA